MKKFSWKFYKTVQTKWQMAVWQSPWASGWHVVIHGPYLCPMVSASRHPSLNHPGLFAKSSKSYCHPLFKIKAMNLPHGDNPSRVQQGMKYEEVISVLSVDHSHSSANYLSKHELNNYCYLSSIYRTINREDWRSLYRPAQGKRTSAHICIKPLGFGHSVASKNCPL